MKIKSDQRSQTGIGAPDSVHTFLTMLAIFKRDGIPLMQSRVTAIPGSQAGQYPACPVSNVSHGPRLSRSKSGLHRLLYLRHFLLRLEPTNGLRERDTGGNVRTAVLAISQQYSESPVCLPGPCLSWAHLSCCLPPGPVLTVS